MIDTHFPIELPIIQAPMAGVTSPSLVAAVSNAGALGSIGAGYLNALQTRAFIQGVKQQTTKAFGINLFVPEEIELDPQLIENANGYLQPIREELGLPENKVSNITAHSDYEQQIQVVLEEKVPVCSFTFGMPRKDIVLELKKNGILVIGTATTVEEAIAVQDQGMDAVVVQGMEAGGHRGSFLHEHYIGLMSLIPQVVDEIHIPVIAAGGIMDGRGVAAALCLGAKAVQMGTAFLTTEESSAHPQHKLAILQAKEVDTSVTKVFSGKSARGITNQFMREMKPYEHNLPPYPIQNSLTKEIRKKAAEQSSSQYMSLWSGQSPRLSKSMSAQQLIKDIMEEVRKISKSMTNQTF
ncbi:nitronate monooxygenase [Oikeobacillus pervagus]|uniref:Probable nitronate monooxygenase n=1 Tax=Oikeobacillus pervagus TaxID=1325931 RepID=A0AAJ1WJW4_9BACI|nr:nitronate monooxygenase [Oikeobacillus pervagus]MDQ0216075.1 nitronate monooxygenase [Oikeobacillus pervagus]